MSERERYDALAGYGVSEGLEVRQGRNAANGAP